MSNLRYDFERFRPLLSDPVPDDLDRIKYPVMVSPKIDGHRVIMYDGRPVSRVLKPIPNIYIDGLMRNALPDGLDGEITVGAATDPIPGAVISRTAKGVRAAHTRPEFTYWLFDWLGTDQKEPFKERYKKLCHWWSYSGGDRPFLQIVPHTEVADTAELLAFERHCVGVGYEGIMLRDPRGKYKFGRSTTKEGLLLKMKRWFDAEAKIVDVVELQRNLNPAKINALGLTERDKKSAYTTAGGTLGALVCSNPTLFHGGTFEIGTGFTDYDRTHLWENPPVGKIVNFKYLGLTPDGVPRAASFRHIRDDVADIEGIGSDT